MSDRERAKYRIATPFSPRRNSKPPDPTERPESGDFERRVTVMKQAIRDHLSPKLADGFTRLLAEAEAKGRLAKSKEIEAALGLRSCVCGECELDTEVLKLTVESVREAALRKGRREQLEAVEKAIGPPSIRDNPYGAQHPDAQKWFEGREWQAAKTRKALTPEQGEG